MILKYIIPFIICPAYSLIWGIARLKHNDKSAIIVVSLVFGLFAFLTPPVTDLYRHTLDYYDYRGMSFYDFVIGYRSFDFIIPFCEWAMSNLRIPYPFLRFALFFLTTYLQLKLFFKIIDGDLYNCRDFRLRLFAVLLLCFSISTIIGVRWGVSVVLYEYGTYYLINETNRKKAFYYFFLASMVHFSMLPFIGFIFFFSFIHIPKPLFPVCFIIATIMSLTIGGYVEGILVSKNLYGADFVSQGEVGSGNTYITFNGLIFLITTRITKIPYVIVFWLFYDNRTLWTRWIGSAILLFALFSHFGVITSRTLSLFSGISLFYLFSLEMRTKTTIKYLKIIILCLAVMTTFTIYQYRKMFAVSHYEYMFVPAPLSITQDYDKNWIKFNLDENGEIKK